MARSRIGRHTNPSLGLDLRDEALRRLRLAQLVSGEGMYPHIQNLLAVSPPVLPGAVVESRSASVAVSALVDEDGKALRRQSALDPTTDTVHILDDAVPADDRKLLRVDVLAP